MPTIHDLVTGRQVSVVQSSATPTKNILAVGNADGSNLAGGGGGGSVTQVGSVTDGTAVTVGRFTGQVAMPVDQVTALTSAQDSVSTEGKKPTYVVSISFTPGAGPTDVFTLQGSASKTIQVKYI